MFGFCIEMDVQLTRDGVAIVFHDYDLQRLLSRTGAVQTTDFADLSSASILGSNEAPPSLESVLKLVAGQVPLVIELKDQSGSLTGTAGQLERRIAGLLAAYNGPVVVKSFNPDQVIEMRRIAPNIPRGLVTEAFVSDEWALVPRGRKDQLAQGAFMAEAGISFISHKRADLDSQIVHQTKNAGLHVLSWTIRSEQEETSARQIADNIVFENYLPAA